MEWLKIKCEDISAHIVFSEQLPVVIGEKILAWITCQYKSSRDAIATYHATHHMCLALYDGHLWMAVPVEALNTMLRVLKEAWDLWHYLLISLYEKRKTR